MISQERERKDISLIQIELIFEDINKIIKSKFRYICRATYMQREYENLFCIFSTSSQKKNE